LGTTCGACQVKCRYIVSAKKPYTCILHLIPYGTYIGMKKLRLKNKIPPPTPIPLLFFYDEIEDRRQEKVTN
jgi:hypothetical protein